MELQYYLRPIRTAAVLTTSYVAGTVMGEEGKLPSANAIANNQLVLYVDFTLGSLTSAEIKIEFSDDDSTYYQETTSSVSSGTSTDRVLEHTFTATGKYRILATLADKYVKVSAKGTGTVTDSSMTIDGIVAVR